MKEDTQSKMLSEKKQLIKLDKKDRKIISALSINSRLTPSELGRIVGLSKDSIRYRINKLKEQKVIIGSALIVNPYSIGLQFNTIFLRLGALDDQEEKRLIGFLVNHPFTMWCGFLSGEWDLGIHVLSKDTNLFNFIIKEIKEKFDSLINGIIYFENTKIVSYRNLPAFYVKESDISISTSKKDTSFQAYLDKEIVGATKELANLDKLDKIILFSLAQNPEITIADLSDISKVSFDTIKNRIIQLIKRKVILSFNSVFNLTSLGLTAFIFFIETRNIQDEQKLEEVLKNNSHIGYALKTHGKIDWHFYVAAKDNHDFYSFVRQIRSDLKDEIKSFSSLTVIQDFKFTFFPEGLKE